MARHKVLVVDDEESHREMLCAVLRDNGHMSIEAANGEEALRSLEKTAVDLVVLDMRMPVMDGMETLSRIKQRNPELPVIMVTAFGEIRQAVEAMRRGAFSYLEKPVDIEEFCLRVDEALQERKPRWVTAGDGREAGEVVEPYEIISTSLAMEQVKELIRMAAGTTSTVLITGESGTGKELVVAAIHRLSARSAGPFVAVNCAALNEQLLESELFGHEKGAFTGAIQRKLGRFERADEGTLFLDEIAEMSPRLQAKLLRLLQDSTFERVGGEQTLKADVRVLAATNRDLTKAIEEGSFREDLYFRLNVLEIRLPPLRERPDDILLLTRHFLAKYGQDKPTGISEAVARTFVQYLWPGNVRELENVVQRALLFARGREILPEHLPPSLKKVATGGLLDGTGVRPGWTVEEVERDLIEKTLLRFKGNRTHAARELGLSRRALQMKIKKYKMSGG